MKIFVIYYVEIIMKKLFPNNRIPLPSMSYDELAALVNKEINKLENPTVKSLSDIDKKLNLPSGTSYEMSGLADYINFKDWYEYLFLVK